MLLKIILIVFSAQCLSASPFNQEEGASRARREIPFRFPIFEGFMKAFSTIAESTVNATNQFAQGISQSFNKSSNTAAESNSTDDKGLKVVKNAAEGFFGGAGAFFGSALEASGTFIKGAGEGISKGASTMLSGIAENTDTIADLAKNGTFVVGSLFNKTAQDFNNVV